MLLSALLRVVGRRSTRGVPSAPGTMRDTRSVLPSFEAVSTHTVQWRGSAATVSWKCRWPCSPLNENVSKSALRQWSGSSFEAAEDASLLLVPSESLAMAEERSSSAGMALAGFSDADDSRSCASMLCRIAVPMAYVRQ